MSAITPSPTVTATAHHGVVSYARLGSALLLVAFAVSATYQVYRTVVAVNPDVDRFGIDTFIFYAIGVSIAVAVRTDRRPVWWLVACATSAWLVFGIVGYYPMIYTAREMNVGDWLEGTLYTGLLITVFGLSVLRLNNIAVIPSRTKARS